MDAAHRDIGVTVYQEQECVMDDELSGESEQILVHGLEQSRDQNHSQVVSGHLVDLREHLDSAEENVPQSAKLSNLTCNHLYHCNQT